MKKWIVVDLDGTLCDCSHRVHLAQAKQWEEFHAGIPNDKPHYVVVDFLAMAVDYKILLCTGRDEKYRNATMKWLKDNDLLSIFDELIMRPNGNFERDHVLKLKIVDEFFRSRDAAVDSVFLILDDRDQVVQAYRDAGFKCWQVNAGEY